MKLNELVKKGVIVPHQTPIICNLQRKFRGMRGTSHRVSLCCDLDKNVRRVSLKGDYVYIEFC